MKQIKTWLVAMLCVAAMPAAAQEQTEMQQTEPEVVTQTVVQMLKFGVIDIEATLKQTPLYKQAEEQMDQLRTKYQAEMKRAEDEFTNKYVEFLQGQKDFPENILLKRQKELQDLMQNTLSFKTECKSQLQKAEDEMMVPLRARMKEAIRLVAQEQGLSFVLNTGGDLCPYLAPEQGVDITEAVVNLMK